MARVVVHRRTRAMAAGEYVRWFINLVGTVILGLIVLRFFFELLGANSSAAFVSFIYRVSLPLTSPFRGIFNRPAIEGAGVVDWGSLLAILVYGIIFYLIQYAVDGLIHSGETVEEHESSVDEHDHWE